MEVRYPSQADIDGDGVFVDIETDVE